MVSSAVGGSLSVSDVGEYACGAFFAAGAYGVAAYSLYVGVDCA